MKNQRTRTIVIIITSVIAITWGYSAVDNSHWGVAILMTAILILNIFLLPNERYQ